MVLAAEGYPDSPKRGVKIDSNLGEATNGQSYFLHAGTQFDKSQGWLTAGGRVLNSMGLGSTMREAIQNAYAQAETAPWPGRQMRTDIGAKAES